MVQIEKDAVEAQIEREETDLLKGIETEFSDGRKERSPNLAVEEQWKVEEFS